MLKDAYPYYLANVAHAPNTDLEVIHKYTGKLATKVALADDGALEKALAAGAAAAPAMARLKSYQRVEVLEHCVRRIQERKDEFAHALTIEAGKPITDARGEVTRLIDTFKIAVGEATRMHGEVLQLDISERTQAYSGLTKRFPLGLVALITPFNFPLNLVAHKIAPALAVGCPFVLKPASATPVGALLLGEILAETDLPKGAFSILPCARATADKLAIDPRPKLLSFTGSQDVGWDLRARAGKKKVSLELGGNAAVIVDEHANLDDVVSRITIGAFYQSGQSCISVQRILAHDAVYGALLERLVARTKTLVAGDPEDEKTFVGPVITEKEAIRIERWIQQAVAAGGKLHCGGERKGSIVSPAILSDVPRAQPLVCKEVFGPVAVMSRFANFQDAIAEVNDSDFGLQAGVFTRDLFRAKQCFEQLEVGGVIINDVPSFRVDSMPYGGVKESGTGREGVRYAMEEMTELKLLVIRDAPEA
jgi:acyl-CoA reductase-like NAD-dependent aldehyde dehydrogenase